MNYSPETTAGVSQKPFLQSGEWCCLEGAECRWTYSLVDVSSNSSTSVSQSLKGTKSESPLRAYNLNCSWTQIPGLKFKPYHSEQDWLEGWVRNHARPKLHFRKLTRDTSGSCFTAGDNGFWKGLGFPWGKQHAAWQVQMASAREWNNISPSKP